MLSFLKSKLFLKHFLIALVLVTILFWSVFKSLNIYSHHDERISVPDFTGLKMDEIDAFVKDKNVNYLIIDSIYDAKAARGTVIKQDPEPLVSVKYNRTIYLSVTASLPPQVEMPKLKDRSLRQAVAMLETYGLKLGRTQYVPDQCLNCVLDQLVRGVKIQPGTKLKKGAFIDLVVGKGLSDEELPVPYFIGLTRTEAVGMLAESSLSEGAVTFESPADTLTARVYKQSPSYSKSAKVKLGSSIDLFFTNKAEMIPMPPDTTGTGF